MLLMTNFSEIFQQGGLRIDSYIEKIFSLTRSPIIKQKIKQITLET